MTTAHTLTTSITGRPAVYIAYREVWPDQIDNLGAPCEFCQLEDNTIQCNVYVPLRNGSTDYLGACRCCAPVVVLDHIDLDPARDAVIEYAKEK
jgi:hypothetical protein